jgi:hypothetical protein
VAVPSHRLAALTFKVPARGIEEHQVQTAEQRLTASEQRLFELALGLKHIQPTQRGDDLLADSAVDALVLDDLQVLIEAGRLGSDKHKPLLLSLQEIAYACTVAREKTKCLSFYGTTFHRPSGGIPRFWPKINDFGGG